MKGISFATHMSRGYARCMSNGLFFQDPLFRVPSSIALCDDESFIMWSSSYREYFLIYARSQILNLSGDPILCFCKLSDSCLLIQIFFPANAKAYLIYPRSRIPCPLPDTWLLVKVICKVGLGGICQKEGGKGYLKNGCLEMLWS